jgi:DMSO/TMAO reductase YedYZ molybdopterin-dependent catalytic subunit
MNEAEKNMDPERESQSEPKVQGEQRTPETVNESLKEPVIEFSEEEKFDKGSANEPGEGYTDTAIEQVQIDLTEHKQTAPESELHNKRSSLLIMVKEKLVEKSPEILLVPRQKIRSESRRDFLIYGAGVAASAAGFWWLAPEEVKEGLGFSSKATASKNAFLKTVLSFDDQVAQNIYSKNISVPTYTKSQMTELPNNYAGQTPDSDYIQNWQLKVAGLASKKIETFKIETLLNKFKHHDQITRLVCVEGWSAIAWWGGFRFADFIKEYPPQADAKWIELRSDVNLDSDGNSNPYFVSLDLPSALHAQTLLATHHNGKILEVEHGAPLRLLAPMKLGLKNIKAITSINYHTTEPEDYWNKEGYSYYDGI